MRVKLHNHNAGFTLVEILVVIAIIGLLAGISLVALRAARTFVGASTVRHRLDDIGQGLEMYKQKYGEYPPDCTATKDEIRRHILKRWPKTLKAGTVREMTDIAYQLSGCNVDYEPEFYPDPGDLGVDESPYPQRNGAPAWAALFWLAGPDGEGFSQDEERPIKSLYEIYRDESDGTPDSRETPMIELSYDSDGTGGGNWNREIGLMFNGLPIVYFKSKGKAQYDGRDLHGAWGNSVAAPYMKNGAWYNPDSFQLIYPGEDGDFGADVDAHEGHDDAHPRDLGDPTTISPADRDNITNFTDGATIESVMD